MFGQALGVWWEFISVIGELKQVMIFFFLAASVVDPGAIGRDRAGKHPDRYSIQRDRNISRRRGRFFWDKIPILPHLYKI